MTQAYSQYMSARRLAFTASPVPSSTSNKIPSATRYTTNGIVLRARRNRSSQAMLA